VTALLSITGHYPPVAHLRSGDGPGPDWNWRDDRGNRSRRWPDSSDLQERGAEEREHQEAELIQQRREAAAVALSAELERLDETLPKPSTSADQAVALIGEAAGLRRCEKRAGMSRCSYLELRD
jgi:hypothetical protein